MAGTSMEGAAAGNWPGPREERMAACERIPSRRRRDAGGWRGHRWRGRLRSFGRFRERSGCERAVAGLAELFDLFFGRIENRPTMLDEEVATFVFEEAFFQADLA